MPNPARPAPVKMLSRSQDPSLDMDERLRILYPMVNEAETPLPRDAFTKILAKKRIDILEWVIILQPVQMVFKKC